MRYKTLFTLALAIVSVSGFAQQLPIGSCGIVCTYDAAGNRLKRVYFCNNGTDPYPRIQQQQATEGQTTEYQPVDALYPNPTSGKFTVTFSKSLTDAAISIMDNNGKVVARFKASGYMVEFDLSPYAAGIYYIRIEEDGKAISKKVVKQ
ncbi:MAG: T9SS type A sorting domain-containing protein [Chitinophagaceae bacterium]